jgi:hypothetical protein
MIVQMFLEQQQNSHKGILPLALKHPHFFHYISFFTLLLFLLITTLACHVYRGSSALFSSQAIVCPFPWTAYVFQSA